MKQATSQVQMQAFSFGALPGVYRVCAEVDAGGGSIRQWLHAPDLAGHVYAGPYLAFDPTLSRVVADDLGVGGYILAAENAVDFEAWREAYWYPALRGLYPLRGVRSDGSADDRYLRLLHMPPRTPETVPVGYPAELHIKLDPRMAGRGWGRRLIDALLSELRARGVSGVHLGVAAGNANAVAFYTHLGFDTLVKDTKTLLMVKDIA